MLKSIPWFVKERSEDCIRIVERDAGASAVGERLDSSYSVNKRKCIAKDQYWGGILIRGKSRVKRDRLSQAGFLLKTALEGLCLY